MWSFGGQHTDETNKNDASGVVGVWTTQRLHYGQSVENWKINNISKEMNTTAHKDS